jgi:hypothetical protein
VSLLIFKRIAELSVRGEYDKALFADAGGGVHRAADARMYAHNPAA